MNNDGNDARTPPKEPRTYENFLSKRTTALAGTQVDAIFYCSGVFNLYHHRSNETECRKRGDQNVVDWASELGKDGGPDSLTTIVDFGHKNKMEVFWSIRMNDTHDSGDPALLCQWKQDHPDYLMCRKDGREGVVAGGRRWSAVNYELPEVREKVFRILQDVATRYDVDGLELDFFRHPVYFKPQMYGQPVTQQQRDLMTDLLARVRKMTDEAAAKRGRPILIAVRVPDSVEYASAVGLDLVRWMKEDLIDLMSVSCYFQLNPWKTSVDLGHAHGVPVYPSLSEARFKNPESVRIRRCREGYRGRALDAWNSGADGIYMFNFFNPKSELWRELGDPKALAAMDQIYTTGFVSTKAANSWLSKGTQWLNLPVPLPDKPIELSAGKGRNVDIFVATTSVKQPGKKVSVKVRLLPDDPAQGAAIVVRLNGVRLSKGTTNGAWVDYVADPDCVKHGANRITMTSPAAGLKRTVSDAAIEIRYSPEAQ